MNLEELDDLLDDHPHDRKDNAIIVKAPFGYHGSKTRSIPNLLKYLPYMDVWVDVFGGSGVVTLNREPSKKLDVYNDRWSGVTTFFRCMRDPVKLDLMINQLSLMPHSKEEFYDSKDWYKGTSDVDRAVKWYYMLQTSYAHVGRNWGYSRFSAINNKAAENLEHFPHIAKRFMEVQIDNEDFRTIFERYDSPRTVFYCDPPYVDAHVAGAYIHAFNENDDQDLMDCIFNAKGYVALSNYGNNFHKKQPWDDVFLWDLRNQQHGAQTETNHRIGADTVQNRTEYLYIKEVSDS